MAWVQVGPHKINTALICYAELEDETVRLYFHGEWEGNPLDLHFDEAKAFWKHLKAEDVTADTASHPPGCNCAFHLQYRKRSAQAS